jgi:hypothetical protein
LIEKALQILAHEDIPKFVRAEPRNTNQRTFADVFSAWCRWPLAIGGKKVWVRDLIFEQNQVSASAQKAFKSTSLRRRKLGHGPREHDGSCRRIGPPMIAGVVHYLEYNLTVLVDPLLHGSAELYLRLHRFARAIAGAHQRYQIVTAQQSFIFVVTKNGASFDGRIGGDKRFSARHQDRHLQFAVVAAGQANIGRNGVRGVTLTARSDLQMNCLRLGRWVAHYNADGRGSAQVTVQADVDDL